MFHCMFHCMIHCMIHCTIQTAALDLLSTAMTFLGADIFLHVT